MMGVAVAVGYITDLLVSPRGRRYEEPSRPDYRSSFSAANSGYSQAAPSAREESKEEKKEGGFLSDLFGGFHSEMDSFKKTAVSSVVGLLHSLLHEAVPNALANITKGRQGDHDPNASQPASEPHADASSQPASSFHARY